MSVGSLMGPEAEILLWVESGREHREITPRDAKPI
jgi:hypothetical protein